MRGLERAGVRLQGLTIGVKVEGPRGSRIDKLFGVRGELAGDLPSQGVQGERQGLVFQQARWRDGGRGAGEDSLWWGHHTDHSRAGATALLHLGRAKLGGGKTGCGEGDGLQGRAGVGQGGRGLLLRLLLLLLGWEEGEPSAGRGRGGGVGGVHCGVGWGAGAGIAVEARAGRYGEGRGRAGERGQQHHRGNVPSDRHEYLSVGIEAQTLGLLHLHVSLALPGVRDLHVLSFSPQARWVLEVQHLHRPLLPDLVGHLVRVDPHAELGGTLARTSSVSRPLLLAAISTTGSLRAPKWRHRKAEPRRGASGYQ